MIKISKQNININKHPLSLSELKESDKYNFSDIKLIEVSVNDYSNRVFHKMLTKLLENLIHTHKLYFIYVEGVPQIKNKIRSLKKMFRSQKSKIGKNNLFELETDLEENRSIISASIKIDSNNIHYCLEELLNSNFLFGYAVQKKKRSFPTNRTNFLNETIRNKIDGRKTFKVNFLKTISQNLTSSKLFFETKVSGKDEEIITIFTKNEFNKEIERVVEEFKSMNKN